MRADLQENIASLKDKFKGDEENTNEISKWEKDLQRLSEIENFVQLKTTREIVQHLKDRYKDIIETFLNGDLAEKDMISYKARKEEIRHILSLFMPQYESEIEEINRLMILGLSE